MEKQTHDALQSIDEQEGPGHGGDVSWVESLHNQTLLQHRFELVAEGEGHLSRDKALENATDSLEHEHVNDTVQVLLDHVVHHVWGSVYWRFCI